MLMLMLIKDGTLAVPLLRRSTPGKETSEFPRPATPEGNIDLVGPSQVSIAAIENQAKKPLK